MPASAENESEILLGNKQLLAVFAVVALLLAIAFTGGYMLGKNSAEKKAIGAVDGQTPAAGTDSSSALITRSVTPDDQSASKAETPPEPAKENPPSANEEAPTAPTTSKPAVRADEAVLGRREAPHRAEGTPRTGQTFIQVAALTQPQAEATADVLRKQHFPARIAPKPGSTTVYRVLVGPTKDPGDITATRDALRKIGFRDVIVQRY